MHKHSELFAWDCSSSSGDEYMRKQQEWGFGRETAFNNMLRNADKCLQYNMKEKSVEMIKCNNLRPSQQWKLLDYNYNRYT